jgi:3-hydroxy-9,10-secoandrosta-1,3,5(10)-triene-9,17-dione monooxygenase reductase component
MIHSENPFLPDPADRDTTRRFRGRLAAPVTIVTAGSDSDRIGLTVSSLFVAEGDPAHVHLVVGPTTDLWLLAADTGRFVVHVCRYEDHQLAGAFAGLRPSPGGLFASVATTQSDWGPLLTDLADRAYCTFVSREETGWSGVVVGRVDQVEVTALSDPLIHFRSGYHRLAD